MNPDNNITQEELENIERYFTNNITNDEKATFEERLQNDVNFKNKVEDIRTMLLGIETQVLKERLEEFHKEIPKTISSKKEHSKVKYLDFRKMVAAAAVIIAIGSFWFFNNPSNERLYSSYFIPDPGLPTTMGSTDNYNFYDAMVDYKQKNYKKAISKWEVLQQESPKNDTLNYFLGVANLADGQTDLAITYLQNTTLQTESVFIEDAHYYLGLAYLKNNKKEKAIKTLQLSHSENSRSILSELEK
jgi:tetratricopeptide (TPR) repeat protein